MTHYLTVADVVRIHDDLDDAPLRDPSGLEAAVARPQQTVGGEDAYPTLYDKAAALWTSIDGHQPFLEGNKRTAFTATRVFFALNAHTLLLSDSEVYEVAMRVARHELDVTQLAEVLKSACVAVPGLTEDQEVDVRLAEGSQHE